MDRRTIIGIAAALGIYFMWLQWVGTNEAPVEEGATASETTAEQGPVEATAPVPVTATPVDVPDETGTFRGCDAQLGWTTRGGSINEVTLDEFNAPYDVTPLWRYALNFVTGGNEGSWSPYGGEPGPAVLTEGDGDAELLGMGAGGLDRVPAATEILSNTEDELVVRGRTSDGIEVTRRLTVQPGETCLLSLDLTWRNTTDRPYSDGVWMTLHEEMPGSAGRYSNAIRPFAQADGDYETWSNLDKLTQEEPMPGPVNWMALADRYFTLALIPSGANAGAAVFSPVTRGETTLHGIHYRIGRTIEPGEAVSESFTVYVGPKHHGLLKELAPGLNKLVALGWFAFFGRFLLMLLHMFHGLIGNWGVSIILLTLLVKGAFFPLTQASFRSSQAMQAIQPKLQEVRERYKDSPEELNKQTLQLFRENGVNPLSGCLPMLVQMPVWIALYNVLLSSVDLYQVEFLYLKDLSSVDPYSVLPAVVVVLMLVQQSFMPTGNMDPMQARMMRLMPLLFGFFFFTFPSGLVVYIFFNMVLTILQQWWIRRSYAAKAPTTGSA